MWKTYLNINRKPILHWQSNCSFASETILIVMQSNEQNHLFRIIIELEKRYPFFSKRDIYATVSDAYKKVHSFFKNISDKELAEVEKIADQDLRLSL
jgi:hypothetical protein